MTTPAASLLPLTLLAPLALAGRPTALHAAGGERADAFISATTANRLLARLLPLAFELPAEQPLAAVAGADAGVVVRPAPPFVVWLLEARYCGVAANDSAGRARILGVVGATNASLPQPALDGAHGCQTRLDELAKHDAISPLRDVALVELLVATEPAHLRITLGAFAAGASSAAALAAALGRARAAAVPVRTIDTDARVLSFPHLPPQAYDVGVRFLKGQDGVGVLLTPTPSAAGHAPSPAPTESIAVPAGTDAAIRISFALGNRLLAQVTQDGPIAIELQGQTIELGDLRADGADGRLTVRGQATPRGLRESARVAIETAGADLKVAGVRAQAEVEDCAGLSMMAALGCRARNSARQAAAAALASELINRLGGQPLRTLASIPPATLTLGPRRLRVQLIPTRLAATDAGLTAVGTIAVEAP